MLRLFIVWVPPHERNIRCGETYDEAQVRAAGYNPADLVSRGEAEIVSPAPEKGKKRKSSGAEPGRS
jgi:hypothetical protein